MATKPARREAKKVLDGAQHLHVRGMLRELSCETDPTRPVTLSVDQIEDFYELRLKGGLLGKTNIRVFFAVVGKAIVILGVIKKEADGATPPATKLLMSRRLRLVKRALESSESRVARSGL